MIKKSYTHNIRCVVVVLETDFSMISLILFCYVIWYIILLSSSRRRKVMWVAVMIFTHGRVKDIYGKTNIVNRHRPRERIISMYDLIIHRTNIGLRLVVQLKTSTPAFSIYYKFILMFCIYIIAVYRRYI